MKSEVYTAVVIKSRRWLSVSPHECWSKVRTLEDSFIAYDLGKIMKMKTYLVYMEIKGGSLSATNKENGKLSVWLKKYKDVKLPLHYLFCIQVLQGWQIVNNRYLYSQRRFKKTMISKRKDKRFVDGEILAEDKYKTISPIAAQ
jgi:hypothetical protein